MEVKDLQNKIIELVSKWDKKREVVTSEQEAFTHLIEEVGELARQYVNLQQRKKLYDKKEVEDAIGDILVMVVKLAHIRGLDIEELILKNIKEGEKHFEE